MRDLPCQPNLTFESIDKLSSAGKLWPNEFQGDILFSQSIEDMQDDAHSTSTEFLDDVISFADDVVDGAGSPRCCAEWFRALIVDSLVVGLH
ncbi:MAG TPA: hypothetical protein VEV41_12640 [Terriglobales bacterium]|nr:hypothetical protein [Terriglobales bacterium]